MSELVNILENSRVLLKKYKSNATKNHFAIYDILK